MLYGAGRSRFWCFRDPIAAVPCTSCSRVTCSSNVEALCLGHSRVIGRERGARLHVPFRLLTRRDRASRKLTECCGLAKNRFFAWTQFRLNPLRSSGIGQDGGEQRSAEPKACHHRRAPQVGLEAPSKLGPGGVRWGRRGHAPLPPGAILGAAGGGKGDGEGEGEEAAGG